MTIYDFCLTNSFHYPSGDNSEQNHKIIEKRKAEKIYPQKYPKQQKIYNSNYQGIDYTTFVN